MQNVLSDDLNTQLKKTYNMNNYEVIYKSKKKGKCYIFFSGNGLYYPNEREVFEKVVLRDNRYEWMNVCQKSNFLFDKAVFVRDIYKQWYVTGINSRFNTIEKLLDFLKIETEGYDVVTVGNSAGGYIAVLAGMVLKAQSVFSFSSQFNLWEMIEGNSFLEKYRDDVRSKYYGLNTLFKQNTEVPIFHFYPGNCDLDIRQSEYAKQINNVYFFKFNEKIHGNTVLAVNYQYIFNKSLDELKTLSDRFSNRKINRFIFLFESAGICSGCISLYRYYVKKILDWRYGK